MYGSKFYGIRDEHKPIFGRQRLTIWSGFCMADFDGTAFELPNHNGFSIRFDFGNFDPKQKLMQVKCPSPRTEQNCDQVDKAINEAINKYVHENTKKLEKR